MALHPKNSSSPAGAATEVTGEYRPDNSADATENSADGVVNRGGIHDDPAPSVNQPTDPSVADAASSLTPDETGEYLPPPTEALTGAYVPDVAQGRTEDVTGEYVAEGAAPPRRPGSRGAGSNATEDEVWISPADALRNQTLRNPTLRRIANLTTPGHTQAAPDAPLETGGRYKFQKIQGKGGMGEVWLADDVVIGRQVAIKRILKKRKELEERFVQEAQVTGQLEHPGIVPVHELGVDERGQPYYVMKFVQGHTLQKVIAQYHAEPKPGAEPKEVQGHRLLNIFLTLCQTVAYAHSRGVIHRDLKPDNVMVGAYGETLLLDWGLAKVVGTPDPEAPAATHVTLSDLEESMPTMMGAAKGTPTYFSPEAATGQVDLVDQLSDVYLFGATLYHILTGKPPRQADKVRDLLLMAKNVPPPPPRRLKPETPKPLDAICAKAMAHERMHRYPTASALAEDVQRYLAGETVSAYRETFLERAGRWTRKHKAGLLRGAALLAIVAIAGAAFGVVREAKHREEDAQRLAQKLQDENAARDSIKLFRRLADEARFNAALADQLTDHAPVIDVAKALDKGHAALKIVEPWGPALERLPLEDMRPPVAREVYDLLLELAQACIRQSEIEGPRQALALLDRAAQGGTTTKSYHRLRGDCLMTLALEDRGAADGLKAREAAMATTALDHYLLGEQARRDSVRPGLGRQVREVRGKQVARASDELLGTAVEHYRRALTAEPEHFWALFQIGQCYVGLGRSAEAVESFGACIALRPQAPWGCSGRANALIVLKRFALAHADVDQALKLDPEFRQALLYRGAAHWKQKEFGKALADFSGLLALPAEQRLTEAAFLRGQLYLEQHDYKSALADFDLLDEAKVELRTVFLHRARIALAQQKRETCLENLTAFLAGTRAPEARQTVPLEDRIRELRTLAHELPTAALETHEFAYQLMLDEINQALKLGRPSAKLYGELGAVQQLLAGLRPKQALQLVRAAIAAYGKGIELDGKDAKLWIKRGWARVDLNAHDEARDDFAAAVKLEPTNAEAHTGLGYAEASRRQPIDARRHANRALLHGGGDYLILHNVACIYAVIAKTESAQEHQDLAIAQLEQALALWQKQDMPEPNEQRLIERELAFDVSLRGRPEFKKLREKLP